MKIKKSPKQYGHTKDLAQFKKLLQDPPAEEAKLQTENMYP